MRPAPIRNQADHRLALAEVEKLWSAEPGSPEEADLELWGLVIDTYEAESIDDDVIDPVDVLRVEMEMNGRTRADLAALIGESRATEILGRKRPLTLGMIRKLSAGWGISADLLIPAYATTDADAA